MTSNSSLTLSVFGRAFKTRSEQEEVKFRLEVRLERKFEMAVILLFIILLPCILLPLGLFLPVSSNLSLALIFCALFSLISGVLGVVAAQLK